MTGPVLIVIAGPIAAGKSTVAKALADRLRRDGGSVALVGLDEIAGMALPSLPDWDVAQAIFASVVGDWLRSGIGYVIAEGPGSRAELDRVLHAAPPDPRVVVVVLTSSFATAFERAARDPTRRVSRRHDFLQREYERWREEEPIMRRDLVIDTDTASVADGVALILGAVGG